MDYSTPEDISALLDGLNAAQREAVCAPPEHVLVLAGAGSGKTRVLIHRIAWLIHVEQCSPFEILAVTFTNKAANEMRGRLRALVPHSEGLWVGTFHGIAHRLLRQHHQQAGLPEAFQIIDSDDQLRAIRRILKVLQLDEKKWPPKQAQWYINKHKDEGVRPTDVVVSNSLFEQHMLAIYSAYQEFCERSGLVDFAELLLRVYELWSFNPDLLQHYRERLRQILVDEFQDTNHLQYMWIKLLAGEHGKVFVVGDDDQSIYAWRGARIEHLHQFQIDFPSYRMVRLEQNYRSSATILQAANALISHNQGRMGKELWTDGEAGEAIALYTAFNEFDEAQFVVARIIEWVKQGGHYIDCAILYRSNAQSRVVEEALVQEGVPYRVYGGLRFFERAEIKDALAYLRLFANPNDDAAFERVVNHPPRGIGDQTLETLRVAARGQGLSLWQAAHLLLNGGGLKGRARNAIRGFAILLEGMNEFSELPLADLCEKVLEYSGLLAHFKSQKEEKDQMRLDNLEELVNAARQFSQRSGENLNPLTAFLSHTTLESGEEQGQAQQDSVQLMTLHSAKGLEFPLVFMCGMEEALFPHQMALRENGPAGLEEERRLCYVGMTRAMQRLYLTYAQVRRLHGSENYSRISSFVGEIPVELIQEIRLRGVTGSNAYHPPVVTDGNQKSGFKVGQVVVHPKFGKGIVLACEGEGQSERVQVDFGWDGKKWLVIAYAHLAASW